MREHPLLLSVRDFAGNLGFLVETGRLTLEATSSTAQKMRKGLEEEPWFANRCQIHHPQAA